MKIEVSNSEVVDRATILQIKIERLKINRADRDCMESELEELIKIIERVGIGEDSDMFKRLKQVNEFLWNAVAEQKEWASYGVNCDAFGEASMKVVQLNQNRYELKCTIDEITKSELWEFKE